MPKYISNYLKVFIGVGLLFLGPVFSQLDYNGCPALQSSDFTATTLVTRQAGSLAEPVKMDFDMDAQGNVDIYFVERAGMFKKYDAQTQLVSTVADMSSIVAYGNASNGSTQSGNNDGLTGVLLDRDFKNNGWVYINYNTYGNSDSETSLRLSRFKIVSGTLILNTEVPILDVPSVRAMWHTGGDLAWDEFGDLWWSTGDNTVDQQGPSNTNDLRGKIIRITPKVIPDGQKPSMGPGSTYEIPQGNLFPVGTAKTRPEIYVMGTRNPYSFHVDPVRRWVSWGEVGPDKGMISEEYNLFTKAGNAGWPYFAGKNLNINTPGGRYSGNGGGDWGMDMDPAAPVNNSSINTGLINLPPAQPAIYAYRQSCAIGGPIYRYDPYSTSTIKLPPHFDRVWLVNDCNNDNYKALFLNNDGTQVTGELALTGGIFPNGAADKPLDINQGPDGALYSVDYSGNYSTTDRTSITRIEYTGSCRPDATAFTSFEKVGCMEQSNPAFDPIATIQGPNSCPVVDVAERLYEFKGNIQVVPHLNVSINEMGDHSVEIFTLVGQKMIQKNGAGFKQYSFPNLPASSLYLVRITTQYGVDTKTVVME